MKYNTKPKEKPAAPPAAPKPPVKFQLTKAIKKEIRKLVKPLPPMQSKEETEVRVHTGSYVISTGVKTEQDGKTPIDPNKHYKGNYPKQINHQTKAEENYKYFGMEGVNEYCKSITDRVSKWEKEQLLKQQLAIDAASKKKPKAKAKPKPKLEIGL